MNVGRMVALLFLLSLSSIALGQNNPVQRGLDLFRQGDYEAALQQFESANRLQPTNALIENLMGITETKLGRIVEANAHYAKAIQLNPANESPHKNLGFNYLNSQQYSQAENELRTASTLDASDPFVHYYLAILYLRTSREKDAILQLNPAESLIENDPDTAYLMAMACLRADMPDKVQKIIDAVEEHSGFSIEQEYNLATSLNSKQMYSQSLLLFEHMAKSQPQSWVGKYNLAIALFDANRAGEALPLLESLSSERPKDGQILSLLGSVYEAVGKLPSALDAYQRAVVSDPENPDRYLDYTRLLMDLDRYDDAAMLIEKGIQNTQDSYALNVRLGAIEMMKGEFEKARESFQKAIDEHPEIPVGYVALAKVYMKEGQDQDAADLLSRVRGKLAKDFALEYVFGLVSYQLGNKDQAVKAFKSAEEMRPGIVEPYYQLGKLYMEAGNWDQARIELEQVVSLNPSHAQAHYQLSRVYARLGDMKKAREMQADASQLLRTQQLAALNAQRARLSVFRQQ